MPETTNPEDTDLMSAAFMEVAAVAAMTPTLITRFQIMDVGYAGMKVLVLGGVGIAQVLSIADYTPVTERKAVPKTAGAFAINRQLAADLSIFLEREFDIDPEFKAERAKNYPPRPEPKNG